ncbi:ABC transporter substrate-binding protein, partial [Cutibacterium acnes]
MLFTAGSVALTIPLLSACGSGDTDAKGSRSKKGTIAKDGVLTIGAAVSTSNVFPHNFNVFGGGDSAPGNAMFWETLFRISSKDGMKLVPNLAKEVKYTSGGKVATYKLRDDVTWNDGKPFTSKDVAFTYGFIFGPPGQSTEKDFKWLAKPIETPDKHTVVVTYNEPQYTEDIPLSLYFPIYPEHIYSKVDHQNYVDKNPVGTGPGKLKSFAGQLIEIDIRD